MGSYVSAWGALSLLPWCGLIGLCFEDSVLLKWAVCGALKSDIFPFLSSTSYLSIRPVSSNFVIVGACGNSEGTFLIMRRMMYVKLILETC